MRKYFLYITIITTTLLFNSCFKISFKGTTIDPKIQTFSVQYFNNRAKLIEPTFSQRFTENLKTYIESNTRLRYINGMGDVDFSGTVNTYQITPQSFKAGTAAMTRFSIGVKVKFINAVNPDEDFEKTFSAFQEFESTTAFSSVESSLSEEIMEEIIEQIFNASFVNW